MSAIPPEEYASKRNQGFLYRITIWIRRNRDTLLAAVGTQIHRRGEGKAWPKSLGVYVKIEPSSTVIAHVNGENDIGPGT